MTQTVTALWSWRGLNLRCMFLLGTEIMVANVLNNSDAIQMTVLVILGK